MLMYVHNSMYVVAKPHEIKAYFYYFILKKNVFLMVCTMQYEHALVISDLDLHYYDIMVHFLWLIALESFNWE